MPQLIEYYLFLFTQELESHFMSFRYCRLASAFQDKVVNNNYHDLESRLGGRNFTAFVDLVLKNLAANPCIYNSECKIDYHWRPLNKRCTVVVIVVIEAIGL